MIETEIPKHTTKEIAESLGISERQTRRICKKIVGHMDSFHLTDTQRARAELHHAKHRRQPKDSGKVH